ncbi:MAG: hypothetical protein IKQ43_05690 [Treponema sp.]|nr:hypothetical protein [Treponema sp.]MBR7079911.1 hypothetical protein [Treponema sp.]
MKVKEINSISKEDGFIYYINRYRGNAVLEILAKEVSIPVSFSIEINPLGQKNIEVENLPSSLNYPVMPVKKSLKEFIDSMYTDGVLP